VLEALWSEMVGMVGRSMKLSCHGNSGDHPSFAARPDRRDRANNFDQFQVARHFAPSIGRRLRQPIRSRDPAFRTGQPRLRRRRCLAHVEFENTPDHDKSPRAVAVLRAHEAERPVAVDEKSAADTARILNDPVSMGVAPNSKPRRLAWCLQAWRLQVAWCLQVGRLRA
jgi:hypothetical protein